MDSADALKKEYRFVVRYKNKDVTQVDSASAAIKQVKRFHSDPRIVVFQAKKRLFHKEALSQLATLQLDPTVAQVELDHKIEHQSTPSSTYYSNQWNLANVSSTNKGALNWESVYAQGFKGQGVAIAVLDTGFVDHPEINGKTVAQYDFISDSTMAGDTGGRDSDATDSGDFCNGGHSSWHGTRVATLAAGYDSGTNVSGVAPSAKLINARVLGRCGGWLSDVADAISWSAGVSVTGVPAHGLNMPVVINMSLSTAPGVFCPSYLQTAVTNANNNGAVVIAAAGNDGQNGIGAPASCQGVVVVSAHNESGDLASYSNYSSSVTLSAPAGGACKSTMAGCISMPVLTAGITGGTTTATATNTPQYFQGTSAAAPLISGSFAVLKSAFPQASFAEIKSALISSGREFGPGSFCHQNANCGFKMADVQGAFSVMQSQYSVVMTVTASATSVKVGNQVVMTANAQANKSDFMSYTWTQVSGPAVVISQQGNVASFVAPAQHGTAVFKVEANNSGIASAAQTVSILFDNNVAPTLTYTGANSVTVNNGETLKLNFNVVDADNNFASLVVTGIPSEATIDSSSITWQNVKTTGTSIQTYTVTVKAVDTEGLASNAVTITVVVNPAASVAGASDKSGGGGGAISISGLLFLLAALAASKKQ